MFYLGKYTIDFFMSKLVQFQFSTLLLLSLGLLISACQQSTTNEQAVQAVPIKAIAKEKTAQKTSRTQYQIPPWPVKAKEVKGKQYPYDEGQTNEGFVAFRNRLYQAVREKDATFLLSITSEDIFFSFGEDAGKANFIDYWKLTTAPETSDIWKELALCLELGGGFDNYNNKTRFTAPYLFLLDVFDDPFTEGVIVGDNVRLRNGQGLDSKIVGSLSWDHVTFSFDNDAKMDTIGGVADYWMNVKTLSGESGYVFGKYARSPIDYRVAFIELADGSWQMEYFAAGD